MPTQKHEHGRAHRGGDDERQLELDRGERVQRPVDVEVAHVDVAHVQLAEVGPHLADVGPLHATLPAG